MSILGEADTLKHAGADILLLVLWGGLALLLASWMGVFRRGGVAAGPSRVEPGEPLGLLLLLLMAGVFVVLFLPLTILAMMGALPTPSTAPATAPASAPQGPLVVLASTIAYLLGAALLIGANRVWRGGVARLGLSLRQLPKGLAGGLGGGFVATWAVFVVATLTELLWRQVGYEHPKEHDLLRMLGQSSVPWISGLLVFSAAIAAPLFEEVLFRGHLQTLLVYGLAWSRGRREEPERGFAVLTSSKPLATDVELQGEAVDLTTAAASAKQRAEPSAAVRWVAIGLTSLAFGAVHPAWTIPPIFVLSLMLGYAYERTGNLWVPITMHAAFNTVSTLIYLLVVLR